MHERHINIFSLLKNIVFLKANLFQSNRDHEYVTKNSFYKYFSFRRQDSTTAKSDSPSKCTKQTKDCLSQRAKLYDQDAGKKCAQHTAKSPISPSKSPFMWRKSPQTPELSPRLSAPRSFFASTTKAPSVFSS